MANHSKSFHETDMMRALFTNFGRAMPEIVQKLPGFEHLAPKMRLFSERVYALVLAATATDLANFNVLNHGDMWANNIMFQYDAAATILDAVLVDFQICYVGSPVLDIVYTLYSSSAYNLRADDWDALLSHYSAELSETLKRLRYASKPIPSLDDLRADLKKRSHHAITLGMYAMGVRNLDQVADDELTKMMGDSEESHQHLIELMLNPNIREALQYYFEYFDRNGFFDCE